MLEIKVLKRLTKITEFLCALIYALFLCALQNKARRITLFYHAVRKQDVRKFKEQMVYLAKRCKVVNPSEIKTAPANNSDVLVAITFDDAFASVVENAVPILKEYGLSAGIFVPAGNLGQPPRWEISENCSDKNETIMSRQQIAELDNDGFEIFSHSFSHPMLTEIEDSRLEAELVSSKHVLEKIVGHEVSVVSYPNGAYDARVHKAAKKAGYKLGFTIEPTMVDSATDCLKIGRFSVSPYDNLLKFKLKVRGGYQATMFLRDLKTLIIRYFRSWGFSKCHIR